jgi:hypothetical protein
LPAKESRPQVSTQLDIKLVKKLDKWAAFRYNNSRPVLLERLIMDGIKADKELKRFLDMNEEEIEKKYGKRLKIAEAYDEMREVGAIAF